MDAHFWHHKWTKNEIGFHADDVNPALVKYFKQLALKKGGRVFVPLCGKTLDIAWLLSQDCRVAGAELSALAIRQLFQGLGLKPEISKAGKFEHYSARNIDLFVGDIFDLSADVLGEVDAVYDRAALVALPEAVRERYARHLIKITNTAPQLVISYLYDQKQMEGPPFSVSIAEFNRHYKAIYDVRLLESVLVDGGLKGQCLAKENIWHLNVVKN